VRDYEALRSSGKTSCCIARVDQVVKVKSLAPNDRFLIAMSSRDGAVETGPPIQPPEKAS
jgi:hypothetical protein